MLYAGIVRDRIKAAHERVMDIGASILYDYAQNNKDEHIASLLLEACDILKKAERELKNGGQ